MKYFTIQELCKTNSGLRNVPNTDAIENIEELVGEVLDPARECFGASVHVNSGYRSPAVNLAANGSKTSQHMEGKAADLKCSDNEQLFKILSVLEYDQLIWEFGNDEQPKWVHVSYNAGKNRKMSLRSYKTKTGKTIYQKFSI